MNLLLDECVDRRLARDLIGHSVTTVPRRGWAGIKNGDLLALAEKDDVFVTVDRKIANEQDLTRFMLAVVLLRARTNRLNTCGRWQQRCWSSLNMRQPAR